MRPLTPIDTTPLFRPLLDELIALLRRLDRDEWLRPTVAGRWRVRDVAAHLLDNDLRRVAAGRDGQSISPDPPITSARDLGRFVNALNAEGVSWGARLSPRILTDLLQMSGTWVADLLSTVPLDAPALWPVSWAGEAQSAHWMDAGREYTERWHHQAQIRDAVGAPLLLAPRWMSPLLDISVRVLPHAYAGVDAPEGTSVTLDVHGETAATWTLERIGKGWHLQDGRPAQPDVLVSATTDAIWRLLYNALPHAGSDPRIIVSGRAPLARPLLMARSVVL